MHQPTIRICDEQPAFAWRRRLSIIAQLDANASRLCMGNVTRRDTLANTLDLAKGYYDASRAKTEVESDGSGKSDSLDIMAPLIGLRSTPRLTRPLFIR